MGFTDSVGNGENNQRISDTRAQQVCTALLAADAGAIYPSRVEVRGYGELSRLTAMRIRMDAALTAVSRFGHGSLAPFGLKII